MATWKERLDEQQDLRKEGRPSGPLREDIPIQDHIDFAGKLRTGNVIPGEFDPSTDETGGSYRIGPPIRPKLVTDAGFSKHPRTPPTVSDYAALAKWKAMLTTASSWRPDLADALEAYRHYLHGNGQPRRFSYDRYIRDDASGRTTLRNAILDAQDAAIKLWDKHGIRNFPFTGPGIPCGSNNVVLNMHFPYPETENWQKTVGGHLIWLSGTVAVETADKEPQFRMKLTLHAEDFYNFNPGGQDMGTGIPDSENGRFEILRWAYGYPQSGIFAKTMHWTGRNLGIRESARPSRRAPATTGIRG